MSKPLTAAEFNKRLKVFTAKVVPEKVGLMHRKIVLQALTLFVMRTPVGNPDLWVSNPPKGYVGGTARGNWQIGHGVIPAGPIPRVAKQAEEVMNAEVGNALAAKPFTITYVTNNVPYIIYLEAGTSTQAPRGMVSVGLQEILAQFR